MFRASPRPGSDGSTAYYWVTGDGPGPTVLSLPCTTREDRPAGLVPVFYRDVPAAGQGTPKCWPPNSSSLTLADRPLRSSPPRSQEPGSTFPVRRLRRLPSTTRGHPQRCRVFRSGPPEPPGHPRPTRNTRAPPLRRNVMTVSVPPGGHAARHPRRPARPRTRPPYSSLTTGHPLNQLVRAPARRLLGYDGIAALPRAPAEWLRAGAGSGPAGSPVAAAQPISGRTP